MWLYHDIISIYKYDDHDRKEKDSVITHLMIAKIFDDCLMIDDDCKND